MRIEYITHASLLFKGDGIHLLTDPFFFLDDLTQKFICHYPARDLSPEYFPALDYVFCSHIHDDHCHEKTLHLLKDKIGTLILPAGQPDFEAKMRRYGFEHFIFLENEVTTTLPSGTTLTCFHDKNGFDTALVVGMEGKYFLHQNDCQLDSEIFQRMAKRFVIDVAFVPHTGQQDLYPLLLPRSDEVLNKLSSDREKKYLNHFALSLKILNPKVVVPYSYTIFYFNEDQLKLNGYNRTTPKGFKKRIQKDLPSQDVWVMNPGDVIEGGDELCLNAGNQTSSWGDSIAEYVKAGTEFVKSEQEYAQKMSAGQVQKIEASWKLYMTERLKQPFPSFIQNEVLALHVMGKDTSRSYYLDIANKCMSESAAQSPFLEITIPASILEAFLSRKYDSFMILYSYRITFQCNALMLLNLSPEEEVTLYIRSLMSLLDDATYQRELAG